jgi:hypothetical protein
MREPLPRRRKLGDPFAAPSKIKLLLDQLLQRLELKLSPHFTVAEMKSNDYQLLVQLLQKASHYIRTGDNTARVSKKFPKQLLLNVIEELEKLLAVQSQNRISFRTFTDNNLRVLDCPDDIKQWLELGKITLFEALQLKRLSSETIAASAAQAAVLRNDFMLRYHNEKWLAHRLRHEIDAHLGIRALPIVPEIQPQQPTRPLIEQLPTSITQPLAIQPTENNSVFSEQIALMIELLQIIDPTEIPNDEMEQLLNNVDQVLLQLQHLSRKLEPKIAQNKTKHNLGFC